MTLVYTATGVPVKVGDKVSGHRLDKYYAHVLQIDGPNDPIVIQYNGDCRSFRVDVRAADAEWRDFVMPVPSIHRNVPLYHQLLSHA